MTATVLVATPYQAFGELLCLSLEDEGQYRTRLVKSGYEAVETLVQPDYQIAILDGDLPDTKLADLTSKLINGVPDLKLVLIPPENDLHHPALAGVAYHGYLLRPFYQPDLLALMDGLVGGGALPGRPALPGWLNEKRLLEALGPTNARGGLLLHRDGSTLVSGDLPENVVEVLREAARRGLQGAERTDMVRFVRLPGQSKDHLFYITHVTPDITLALSYMVGTPLSRVRIQASQVTATLASKAPLAPIVPEGEEAAPGGEAALAEAPEAAAADAPDEMAAAAPTAGVAPVEGETGGVELPTAAALVDDAALMDEELDDELEIPEINLASLLGDVPPPDPGKEGQAAWVPEISMSLPRPQDEPIFPWDEPDFNASVPAATETPARADAAAVAVDERGAAAAWAEVLNALPPVEPTAADEATRPLVIVRPSSNPPDALSLEVISEPSAEASAEAPAEATTEATVEITPESGQMLDETIPVPLARRNGNFIDLDEPPIDALEDTRPHVLTNLTNIQQIEPVTPAYSQLSYTCVLIPRLPKHHLTGRLGEQLSQWVQQLCLAFGWRLEGIAVRPEYLQWTVQVSPSIAPGNLVRIIRQRVSDLVFEGYPSLSGENPSGDFWATGYLIVGGAQPPSPRLLRDYIAETRRRQGVTPGGETLALQGGAQAGLPAGSPAIPT